MAHRSNPIHIMYDLAYIRMAFTFLSDYLKIKRIFHDMKILWNSNFTVHKVLLEQGHAHIMRMAAFMLQLQNWIVMTGSVAHKV